MGVLYKPFAILARVLGKRAGRATFAGVWERVGDGERPPKLDAGRRGLTSVFAIAAFEAAILGGVGAVAEQLIARAFHHLFGVWPGRAAQPADRPDELTVA